MEAPASRITGSSMLERSASVKGAYEALRQELAGTIVGQDDVISTVEEMRNIAQQIPSAELIEIPGAGHMAPLEMPELVNAAIRSWID